MTTLTPVPAASPPTARVVRVLEHLAARPDEPRNTTEIARELGLARATCALVIEELTSSGWVVQTPRGYVLGPCLVPVGRAALASPAAGALAHDQLVALADELDLVCTTAGVIGDQIVVLDRAEPKRAAPQDEHEFDVQVGMRFPFAPPSGIVNVAWQNDATIEAWLRRGPRSLCPDDHRRLWAIVADVRAAGVFVERLTPQVFQLQALLAGLAADDVSDALRRAVGDALIPLAGRGYRSSDLRPGRSYPVSIVVAPTFDDHARQHLVISAFVAKTEVPHRRVMHIADRVRATADRVTTIAGGLDPWTKA